MNQGEYEALMADTTKRVEGDISWSEDVEHSPALYFTREVESDVGEPLFVKGYLNRASRKLTYVLVHRVEGRVYGLDLGQAHKNPGGDRVGEKHKHRWTEELTSKQAYEPNDITESFDKPVAVWDQFCSEAQLTHNGNMYDPPAQQLGLLL